MKKLFTIFTILTLCTYGAYSQNAPIDFEEDGIGADWEWTVFENDTNPSIEIIDNPDMSGINTSQRVAQFTALESGQPWAGFESSHGSSELGPFVLDESNSTITVMVWKSVISDVGVKLVSETGWAEAEILVSNTVTNEWEELTFDFSGRSNPPAAEGQFDQIVLYGDFDLDGREQDNVVYFDNITFSESMSQEDEPATAAPEPTEDPDNVISLFSEAYDDVDVDTWRTDWSVGQLEDIEIDGNPTKLYTMLDVIGIETTGDNLVDASGMEYFHMDVWTPNMDVVRIKLVDFGPDGEFGGGDDSEHEIVFDDLAQGEWHSLQIPMDDFEGLESAENLAQYILSGTPVGEGTLYVDNVYFSGDGNGNGDDPEEVTVEIDASSQLVGFANVFETPEDGGEFVFGSPWSVEDIKTEVDSAENTVTLFPNFNTYADNPTDSFWVDQETGLGNKIFEGNTFVEDADLAGKIVTFEGEVQSYTLSADYDVIAFIRVFNADFSAVKEVSEALTEEGHFSITFNEVDSADALVQYGFAVTGLNANPEDEEALGNVVIGGEEMEDPEEVVVEVDATADFIGFANVFETPENGGEFVFGAPWSVEDIKTEIDPATNTVTLFPNFNTYADNPTDSFWVDQETGLGNKVFEGNTFVEDSDLVGKIVTFEGEVLDYSLSPDYEAKVFIRVFNADFSELKEVSEVLTGEDQFSITFDDPDADDAVVQYGFSVTGLNANPEDEEALGNVVISGKPVVGPEEVIVEVDASSNFIGFANVFETPENGGEFVFGAPWGVEDIKTEIDSAANTVTLFPNFNTYADNPTDSFWVDQATGLGNKVFEGNTFVEDASLVGKIVTFEGEVQSYTLSPDYEARVFIRVFNADFSVLKEVSEELTEEGHFSITFDDPEADDALVQYGFSVTGLNANPEDEEALGNVVIGDEVDPDLDEPMNPAPLPTEDPENVISLFSEAFEDIEVDTWRTEWSMAEFEDIEIQGNPTKLYTMLDFAGIETTGDNLVDATEMEFFHMDIWTPNMDVVRIKLVDFGPDGEFGGDDDTEHEIVFEGLAKGEWHSLQIPLEDFEGLESTANLAQYILSGTPVGEGVLYVDNVYFSKTPVSVTEIEDHQISLFPNPASDMIHIESEEKITGITVFDYSGKTVLQLDNPSNQIDISALPGGMYVVVIEGKDLFATKRIVIK